VALAVTTGADGAVCCPSGSSIQPGSSDCTCDAGYTDIISTVAPNHPPYLAATAEGWDSTLNRFTDMSGNGRHGTLVAGTAQQGTVAGHGASVNVPFVGGTQATQIQWPEGSIPSTFTVCSVTRYTSTDGNLQHKILQAVSGGWCHGHWGNGDTGVGHPGAVEYGPAGNLRDDPVDDYTKLVMTSRTDWVVMCGRNTDVSGQVGTMANGVTTSTAEGGTGNVQLGINIVTISDQSHEISDWQLSRVYVWDSHLPDDVFYARKDADRMPTGLEEPPPRRPRRATAAPSRPLLLLLGSWEGTRSLQFVGPAPPYLARLVPAQRCPRDRRR